MLVKITINELYKILAKPRSYIGFLAITTIIVLIEFALYVDGKNYIGFIFQALEQTVEIQGEILNGSLVCFIILQTLIIQMPLLVALVTGDLISGEMASGTIRLLATRPVSRQQILWGKILAGGIYVFALLFWLGLLALGGGLLLFGSGDLTVLKTDELVILREEDVIWRFISAFGIAFISLFLVASFSLMLSCFTDNSIGPIIMAMSVIVLFTIIGTMEVPIFDKIKPFLFTTHMVIWRNFFDNPVSQTMVIQSVSVLLGHIALFLGIAHYKFTKTDIQN